ncbi:polysaccharide pyruvyl transferase family protein, partial [Pleurocapsales cyanobacterium LEGE 10410]|nr:polysaccharide pyruvyl transferase family protein [Pleurocapsales cyanobacterium LEGE 10410]
AQGYILLYTVKGFTIKQENQIKSLIELLTKNKNYLVLSLCKPNKLADLNVISIDPKEWVEYFKNASYVITNSYHGTIFSLKFERLFTVLTSSDNIKIKDLLRSLDLESRIIDLQETISFSQQSAEINYERVHESLEEKIALSKKYLVEALDEKKISSSLN